MIHYTCDCCHRAIKAEDEVRYVVRMEVYAAYEEVEGSLEIERDHLEEMEELLDNLDDLDGPAEGDYQQVRYDLCDDCRKKFLSNPLGRFATPDLGFSNN